MLLPVLFGLPALQFLLRPFGLRCLAVPKRLIPVPFSLEPVQVGLRTIPFGLFPQQDTGMIQGSTLGPQDISFPAMKARQEEINAIVSKDPDVDHVVSSIGGFGASTGSVRFMANAT